ncbi:MAG: glycosyltransferase family 2 protein [Rhodospirillales bacterium]|nr:glycosyltransferase family 2 protein [Rhodospirillales bacterium]
MISVIIPTLNEAKNLAALIGVWRAELVTSEIIVADAYSLDGTAAVAESFGARVVLSEPGRGRQLHEGARGAKGDVLLFLHADSVFPEGGLGAIDKALADDPKIPGGNFRLLFDGDDGFSRWLEGFYAWIRARGIYYGDSGIFVRRDVYERIGPIRPLALMEDLDFVRRLEKSGPTCCISNPALTTSSRRFEGRRPAAIVWGWIKIHALYYLGVKPERLARLYDSERLRAAV